MAFKKEIVEIIEPRDVFVGNIKAEVTLEEFGEYESEVCAKANEIVKKLLEEFDGLIRFNFRHFPLTNIHQRSLKAGEAAVATAQDGKFWEMHNILFANRKNLGTTSLKLYSKEAGVVNKRFLDDLVNATYGWQVQGDLREGLDRGVKEVPTFFVNGERVVKPTYEEIKKLIEDTLKKIKKKNAPKTTHKAPIREVRKAPGKSVRGDSRSRSVPKVAAKPVEKVIVKTVAKAPAKSVAKAPAKPLAKTHSKATAKTPAKSVAKQRA
ncbi:MAG: thioredoxin domain-containing protein [Ferruginibacter sp.]